MMRKPNFSNMDTDIESDRLLKAREVARILSVSVDTLRGWRSKNPCTGVGPEFVRVGGLRVRYSLRAIREYLRRNTVLEKAIARSKAKGKSRD